ncbi:hypothetical protein ACFY3G_02785 [Streptomyces phaeochromogenes]|uniref:hypothetical protein n=1 Tax=Streptomyces phaeochromogenes TaxID=1923 RepID=UPI0036B8C187
MRRLLRALIIAVVCLGGPALIAAAVAHAMLDDTAWTDTRPVPAPTVLPVPVPSASQPERPAGRGGQSGLLGTCVIPTATGAAPTACTTRGALRVVGTVRRDAAVHRHRPCEDVPFTTTVRRHGSYWLCLGTA